MALDVPAEQREWYRNPDGSCVQCALGLCGLDQNVPAATTLLWDTDYGPAERGGSWPQRVASYCKSRGIKAFNITGENTWEWMKWAANTGRGAAIGAGTAHFQALVGYDPVTSVWYVNNNNSPQKIDAYSDADFRRLHLASGQWVVVLDSPPHPDRPQYQKWWRGFGAGECDCDACGGGCPCGCNKDEIKIRNPEVERDAVVRLGNMVQRLGVDGIAADEVDAFVEAVAPPADDSGKWFIYIVTMQGCQPCAKLKRDWASSQDLQAFAKPSDASNSWAHFTTYDKDDETQAWRFKNIKISSYPTIIIQPPRSGTFGDPKTVVFQKAGYDGDPKKLAQAMSSAIRRYSASLPKKGTAQRTPPFKPSPKPSPVLPPDVGPPPVVPPNIPPDVPPSPDSPLSKIPVGAWLLGAGLLYGFLRKG
jgi:hypothetical protein